MRLEALRGSERRVVRIVGMVGLTLDETPTPVTRPSKTTTQLIMNLGILNAGWRVSKILLAESYLLYMYRTYVNQMNLNGKLRTKLGGQAKIGGGPWLPLRIAIAHRLSYSSFTSHCHAMFR